MLDDLTILAQNLGQRGQRAEAFFDDADFEGMRTTLIQRAVPLAEAGEPQGLADNQVVVTDGDSFDITGGSVELDVVDGEVTGGTYTPD
ncbi:MAG TPA: hypothetical protein VGK41_01230 [Solirubrobacterales bacterium]